MKAVWSSSLPLTPYRGVLNRLSIAHCKALGESCLLSHKSSSWGVVGRSYGRQKKMANGTMKMVKASLNTLWATQLIVLLQWAFTQIKVGSTASAKSRNFAHE